MRESTNCFRNCFECSNSYCFVSITSSYRPSNYGRHFEGKCEIIFGFYLFTSLAACLYGLALLYSNWIFNRFSMSQTHRPYIKFFILEYNFSKYNYLFPMTLPGLHILTHAMAALGSMLY